MAEEVIFITTPWVKAKKRLPTRYKVVCFKEKVDDKLVYQAEVVDGGFILEAGGKIFSFDTITHWMYLPGEE